MVSLRFSLHTLADMFELPDSVVHSTISKMIINEELQVRTDRLIWINCRTLFSVKLHTQIISQITEDAVVSRTCGELAFCCFCSSQASWDEPTQTVVMHRGAEPTLLQSLALQLAEKVSGFVCLFPLAAFRRTNHQSSKMNSFEQFPCEHHPGCLNKK